ADVVVAVVVVVGEVEVDAELRRARFVEGGEARGVQVAFRPTPVGRGVAQARRLDRGRRGLEVSRLERGRSGEAARLDVGPAGAVRRERTGAARRAAAQAQGRRED